MLKIAEPLIAAGLAPAVIWPLHKVVEEAATIEAPTRVAAALVSIADTPAIVDAPAASNTADAVDVAAALDVAALSRTRWPLDVTVSCAAAVSDADARRTPIVAMLPEAEIVALKRCSFSAFAVAEEAEADSAAPSFTTRADDDAVDAEDTPDAASLTTTAEDAADEEAETPADVFRVTSEEADVDAAAETAETPRAVLAATAEMDALALIWATASFTVPS